MFARGLADWSAPPTKSSPTDIVTQTDLESEELIRARLAVATPDSGFVGEESGSTEAQRRLQWVVDPLDGTVNFWYGLPVVAVSIAAAIDGVVCAAAVVDVERRETFSAAAGTGARAERYGDHGVELLGTRSSARHDRLLVPRPGASRPGCRRRTCVAEGAGRAVLRIGCAADVLGRLRPHGLVLRAGYEDLGLRRGGACRPGSRRRRRAALPGESRLGDGGRAGNLRRTAPTRRPERADQRVDAARPRACPVAPHADEAVGGNALGDAGDRHHGSPPSELVRINVAVGGEVGVGQRPAQLG